MNELKIFNYDNKEIRTQKLNDNVWFCLKDVCNILELKNPTIVAQRLEEDEVTKLDLGSLNGITNFINESGLYSVILRSDKQEAKKFKKWVTSEVLPSIRKHGAYMTNDTLEKALTSPEFLIQLATNLKIEKEKNKMLTDKIEIDRPKVIFAEALAVSEKSILIGELSKILNQNGVEIGAKRLFEWLRSNNYLMAKGESYNQPSQKSMNLKLMEIKKTTINNSDGSVRVTTTTKITPKGQEYFINKFLKNKELIEAI